MLHVLLPFTTILISLIVKFAVSMSHILIPITLVGGAIRPGTSSDTVSHAVLIVGPYILPRIFVGILLVLL